jgi:hypothetical protein
MSETYGPPGTGPAPATEPGEPPAAGPVDVADVPEPAPAAPQGPQPLGVVVGTTGNADVDAAVARLADADELPTEGHIEVYEDVHRGLRDALAALDENRG